METRRRRHATPAGSRSIAPPGIAAIQALGGETAADISRWHQRNPNYTALLGDDELGRLASSLAPWEDQQRRRILREVLRQRRNGRRLDTAALQEWSMAHAKARDGLQGILACIRVEPPAQIRVVRQLTQVSMQKRVFEARWLAGRRVVLKQFLNPTEAALLVAREELTHPLTMSNPYVIESFVLANESQPPEKFVVEEYLQSILPLNWTAAGIEEAANLLFDIANALAYIHFKHDLVHCDVKPDNIGLRSNHFVLLDFGTAKRVESLSPTYHPSGTLRTRAPELLGETGYPAGMDPKKADVWALGATIFRGFAGRFPLFTPSQRTPPVAKPEKRLEFETILRNRADRDWDIWVDLRLVPHELRWVVGDMLQRDPSARPTSRDVIQRVDVELAAFLREPLATMDLAAVSVQDEVTELERALPARSTVLLLTKARRLEIRDRIAELSSLPTDELLATRLRRLQDRLGDD